jgi:hypothetical protein
VESVVVANTQYQYVLEAQDLKITYLVSGFQGLPYLTYQDSAQTLSFRGTEIRAAETEIGSLVTVTLKLTVDAGSTSFSVLIPAITLADTQAEETFKTVGVLTVHKTALVGPPSQEPEKFTKCVSSTEARALWRCPWGQGQPVEVRSAMNCGAGFSHLTRRFCNAKAREIRTLRVRRGYMGSPVIPIPVSDCKENPIDVCTSTPGPAVLARCLGGAVGVSASGATGVLGQSITAGGSGVMGENRVEPGTSTGNGVTGVCNQANGSGVWGNNTGGGYGIAGNSDAAGGVGVYGRGGRLAGHFDGHVETTGYIKCGDHVETTGYIKCGNPNVTSPTAGTCYVEVDVILQNQDCAEDFEVSRSEEVDPGSVVVIESEGAFKTSDKAYDKRVAGVISGAGACKPGIILGRTKREGNRMPVALLGKVFCKVDASREPIEVGDLLTTSPIPGHAMKAADPLRAFGAVIGKALAPMLEGQGLIPILVALQ